MSIRPQKPHVSAALAQLRHGVSFAATIVCTCALLQMLIFGFLHFTTVRYAQTERPTAAQPLSVVAPAPVAAAKEPGLRPPEFQPMDPAPVPKALSGWDPTLHILSDISVTVGVISSCMLTVLCLLGVAVAGGGSIPGVERAVSAATWSLALALTCIPWRDVLVSLPFPGVFSSYAAMATLSEAVDMGQGSVGQLLSLYLLFPLAAVGVSLLAMGRFRQGVAEGIIVTAVSELDDRLEKEIALIRARGIAPSTPRVVAALNEAIGDKPQADADPEPAEFSQRAPEPRHQKPARGLAGHRARQAEAAAEDDFKRPI